MIRGLSAHAFLATTAAMAIAAAACGGGNTDTPAPNTPKVEPTAPATGTASTPTPPSTGTGTVATPPTATPPAPGLAMKPITASSMAGDLTALGLDPKKLPALSAMKPDQLRQLMKTFTKATGMQCSGCHDQNDFHAPTPNKKVAAKMWDAYTRGLTFEDGSLVYCDSCHQGKGEFLDSHDKKALGTWMDDNFVSKLKRVDKKANGCAASTCHGESMDMHIIEKWKK